ncbi:hypothetical protein [Thermus oshimai]|uniref:hypothetical protein n=1 Tax=Thermus oshimai TaxID=56957 RepID=UPI000369801A|nr:hypothetical protein [Thermus oshimai]
MRRALFLLGLLLSACSLSLTVVLPDQTLNLPGLGDTGGRVVYPQEGLSFTPPPVDVVRGVRVDGILEASQLLTATLEFYARTEDPGDCDPVPPVAPSVYLCAIGPDDEKVGEATFSGTSRTAFTLQGETLAQGIRQGRLWLGLKYQGLPSTPLTLTFKGMKATVTVGF